MAMLEIKDLEVYYGMIQAIKGVSFEVSEGEVIALIGANGAGKTTILHTITGLLEAKKGSVMFDGKDYITYTLATGYLTDASYSVSSKVKKKIGRLAYVGAGIKSAFHYKALPLTVKCDNERIHGKFIYLMVMNGESAGGFRLNKGEIINNGKVKVVMIKKTKGLGSLFTFVKLFLFGIKSITKSKNAIVREVKSFEIENHSNTPFTVDGEKDKFLKKEIHVQQVLQVVKR